MVEVNFAPHHQQARLDWGPSLQGLCSSTTDRRSTKTKEMAYCWQVSTLGIFFIGLLRDCCFVSASLLHFSDTGPFHLLHLSEKRNCALIFHVWLASAIQESLRWDTVYNISFNKFSKPRCLHLFYCYFFVFASSSQKVVFSWSLLGMTILPQLNDKVCPSGK